MPRETRFEPDATELESRQLTTGLVSITHPGTGGSAAEICRFGSGSIRPANIRDPIGQVVDNPIPIPGSRDLLVAPVDWDQLVLILIM